MAGLLDFLSSGSGGGGLLDFLRQNALQQQFPNGLASDQAQYSPMNAMAQAPQMAPQMQAPQGIPQNPPAPVMGLPQPQPPSGPSLGDRLLGGFQGLAAPSAGGLLGHLAGAVSGFSGQGNQTAQALLAKGVDPLTVQAAIANPILMKQIIEQTYAPPSFSSAGNGYVLNSKTGKVEHAFEPDDKTPTSVLEYNYYKEHLAPGQTAMPYDVWSTAKARAAATNITNNVDMNSGQTYDKQLAEGLGKAHAALANGVEDAQARSRDVAAMQAAVDAIQKNGGTTGGLAPAQRLELQKSINAGASALGIEKPFSESDLSDKEFLTKFNRQMAGNMAKSSVGNRVTNFEMSNFLKANPGLEMTLTGNQRLLGIQAQIEQRNVAVGNAIRDATATAIAKGEKINPVTVQNIISNYDQNPDNHIKDPVTGQDLTKSYTLSDAQAANPTNQSMSQQHEQNIETTKKVIGNKTYFKKDGKWFVQ
jgi:hypothetical protein